MLYGASMNLVSEQTGMVSYVLEAFCNVLFLPVVNISNA